MIYISILCTYPYNTIHIEVMPILMFTHKIYLVMVCEYPDLSADRRRRVDRKTSHQSPAVPSQSLRLMSCQLVRKKLKVMLETKRSINIR